MDMQARHAVETRHPASQGLYSQEAQREHQWVYKTMTLSSYQLAKAWLGSTLEALICEEAAALETKADEGGQYWKPALSGVLWEESRGSAASGKCAEMQAGQDCTCFPRLSPQFTSLEHAVPSYALAELRQHCFVQRVPTTATFPRLTCWLEGDQVLFSALQMSAPSSLAY